MTAKGIIIDPFAFLTDEMSLSMETERSPIFEFILPDKEVFDLDDIYRAMNYKVPTCIERQVDMVQVIYPDVLDGDTAYCDEEALLHPPQLGFVYMRGWPEPVCGRVLIVGQDDEGRSVSTKWTPQTIAKHVVTGVGQYEFRAEAHNGGLGVNVVEHSASVVEAWLQDGVKFETNG